MLRIHSYCYLLVCLSIYSKGGCGFSAERERWNLFNLNTGDTNFLQEVDIRDVEPKTRNLPQELRGRWIIRVWSITDDWDTKYTMPFP